MVLRDAALVLWYCDAGVVALAVGDVGRGCWYPFAYCGSDDLADFVYLFVLFNVAWS